MKTSMIALFLALSGLAGCAAYPAAETMSVQTIQPGPTLEHASNYSFDDTLSRLESAINARGLTLFTRIDHAKGARSVGMDLQPATLLIFGNPKAGTPLIQTDIRMGLDLPLKMLVYQSGEQVFVTYRPIASLAADYSIAPEMMPLPKIAEALSAIARETTGKSN